MVVEDGVIVLVRGRGIRCDYCGGSGGGGGCIRVLVLECSIVLGGLLEGREEGLIREFWRKAS